MQKLVRLIAAISLAVAVLVSQSVVANAASVVGTINGGGTATMTDGMGVSSFAVHATLFSDGTARGRFVCVDQMGSAPGYPGNVFGDITSWRGNDDGSVTLYITNGKFVAIPGGLVARGFAFTVTIHQFGGAGVGRWTLDFPGATSPVNGGPICQERLVSGQIVFRRN